jgi:hypothetical protein
MLLLVELASICIRGWLHELLLTSDLVDEGLMGLLPLPDYHTWSITPCLPEDIELEYLRRDEGSGRLLVGCDGRSASLYT